MTALAEFFGMLGFAMSLLGWGAAVRRVLRLPGGGSWAVTLVLGLAAVVFIGGVLNLARIALPLVLLLVVTIGLGSAAYFLKGRVTLQASGVAGHMRRPATVYGLAAVILAFAFVTQLEPAAFNAHDDFQKYFAHPVRMLETGTLFGSRLSALGSETLGGQAFLHGFMVAAFPIAAINGVDAVFGLFLCLALAAGACRGEREHTGVPLFGLLSVTAVVLIHPQYVNISALYLGSALIMAAVALTSDADELKDGGPPVSAAALGLVYAALLALKTTFALFVAIHLPLIGLSLATSARWRDGLVWSAQTALSTGLFLAPWIGLQAPHYWAGLQTPAPAVALTEIPDLLDLFATEPLAYGGSMAAYTALTLLTFIIACANYIVRPNSRAASFSTRAALASAITLATGYIVFVIPMATRLAGVAASVRYFTPLAIGIVPMIIGFAGVSPAATEDQNIRRRTVATLMSIPFLLLFLPSFADRIDQAWNFRSSLAFSGAVHDANYMAYSGRVLHGDVKAKVQAAQAAVPAGAPLTAWIDTPFYLDYARNPITDVDLAGLTTPWAQVPDSSYVVWQYRGYATRQRTAYIESALFPGRREQLMYVRGLAAFDAFENRKDRARIVYDDGEIVVMFVGN